MKDYKTLLKDLQIELEELETKISKLNNFISIGGVKQVGAAQEILLYSQLNYMRLYAQILKARIGDIKENIEKES